MADNQKNLFSVAGKTAVVTGGAKGIGAMITEGLIDAGANVLVVSRSAGEAPGITGAARSGRDTIAFLRCSSTFARPWATCSPS